MSELDDDLEADVVSEQDWIDVPLAINGKHHSLRFFRMDGLEWADVCDRHPMREGVPLDANYGYNLRSATPDAAERSGKWLIRGETVEVTAEQWAKIFKTQSGSVIKRIGDALFNLNQWLPDMAVAAAKKASEDESKQNSSLLDNSGSPVVD